MKKPTKSSVGKFCTVIFADHAMNNPVIECQVWGKLVHVDEKQIVVRAWECRGQGLESNNENFSLLISTISSFKIIK